MKQAFQLAVLEGIAMPGIRQKVAVQKFDDPRRPILIDAAKIAAAAVVAAARQKRGAK